MTGRPLTAVELQAVGDGEAIIVQWARSSKSWPMTLRFIHGAPSAWTRGGESSAIPGDDPLPPIFVGWIRPGLTSIDDRVFRDSAAPASAPELFHAEQKRKD